MVDANNYYVVRANALEDNVVTYIVKDGRRIDLPIKGRGRTYGAKAPVAKTDWNTLAVSVRGGMFKNFAQWGRSCTRSRTCRWRRRASSAFGPRRTA